jgi:hypothetical protein
MAGTTGRQKQKNYKLNILFSKRFCPIVESALGGHTTSMADYGILGMSEINGINNKTID